MDQIQLRLKVLEAARVWIDTPYQHQACVKGAGTDCLGLVRGIWKELYGSEPEVPPAYTPDWGELTDSEPMLDAANRWLLPISNHQAKPGDILLFRMVQGGPCKHIGIMSAEDRIIHAYWGKAVIESFLVPYWRRRWTHSFRFPLTADLKDNT